MSERLRQHIAEEHEQPVALELQTNDALTLLHDALHEMGATHREAIGAVQPSAGVGDAQ